MNEKKKCEVCQLSLTQLQRIKSRILLDIRLLIKIWHIPKNDCDIFLDPVKRIQMMQKEEEDWNKED